MNPLVGIHFWVKCSSSTSKLKTILAKKIKKDFLKWLYSECDPIPYLNSILNKSYNYILTKNLLNQQKCQYILLINVFKILLTKEINDAHLYLHWLKVVIHYLFYLFICLIYRDAPFCQKGKEIQLHNAVDSTPLSICLSMGRETKMHKYNP